RVRKRLRAVGQRPVGRGAGSRQLWIPARARAKRIDSQDLRPFGDQALLSRVRRLGRDASLVVAEDLVRRTHALRRSPLHEALEILGAVLAGEMDGPIRKGLAGFFVTAEDRKSTRLNSSHR